ncbi:hypothetical protein RIEGSTA812A_PEG_189 [invertebrate metagenome]|uniref:Uncharacterized protein n=1 Tax=invertebrate metagenome TaxID=1711999 RepID=A0A484H4H7_9ZZZZ
MHNALDPTSTMSVLVSSRVTPGVALVSEYMTLYIATCCGGEEPTADYATMFEERRFL